MDFDDLTDEQLLIGLRDETEAPPLENQARDDGDDATLVHRILV